MLTAAPTSRGVVGVVSADAVSCSGCLLGPGPGGANKLWTLGGRVMGSAQNRVGMEEWPNDVAAAAAAASPATPWVTSNTPSRAALAKSRRDTGPNGGQVGASPASGVPSRCCCSSSSMNSCNMVVVTALRGAPPAVLGCGCCMPAAATRRLVDPVLVGCRCRRSTNNSNAMAWSNLLELLRPNAVDTMWSWTLVNGRGEGAPSKSWSSTLCVDEVGLHGRGGGGGGGGGDRHIPTADARSGRRHERSSGK